MCASLLHTSLLLCKRPKYPLCLLCHLKIQNPIISDLFKCNYLLHFKIIINIYSTCNIYDSKRILPDVCLSNADLDWSIFAQVFTLFITKGGHTQTYLRHRRRIPLSSPPRGTLWDRCAPNHICDTCSSWKHSRGRPAAPSVDYI